MIVSKLTGGLGNQMFQYAMGRNLSLMRKEKLLLDISSFGKNIQETPRKYELDVFRIRTDFANDRDIRKVKMTTLASLVRRKLFPNHSTHVLQRGNQFSESYLRLNGNIYLDGYWQGEVFFQEHKEQIRKDFTLKKISPRMARIIDEMAKINSVSVHIRRGDYVTNQAIKQIFCSCGISYYRKAIKKINSCIDNPYFYFFTDDMPWVKKYLITDKNMKLIEGFEDYEELILMSNCKHNIIANSSFSWWGAWLNQNPDKIVIAPKKWFNDPKAQESVKDLILIKWIKL